MRIFPAFYFGPIEYFAHLKEEGKFLLEAHENFQKQTYRNRCYIQGANGKLRLAIPIAHTGVRAFKDIQPAYEFDWQKEHYKSLESAYKSSPYFEYYEDDLIPIFEKKEKYLLDLNTNTLEFLASKLDIQLSFELTDNYIHIDDSIDFRKIFNAKEENTGDFFPVYHQVFSDKHDFMPNLSILDILFNEGPRSKVYLDEVKPYLQIDK